MTDFATIDPTNLEDVTGGALPIRPIIRGVEKGAELVKDGYKLAKPYLKKAADGLNIAGNVAVVGEAIHQGWNYFFPPPPPPAPQANGGQP